MPMSPPSQRYRISDNSRQFRATPSPREHDTLPLESGISALGWTNSPSVWLRIDTFPLRTGSAMNVERSNNLALALDHRPSRRLAGKFLHLEPLILWRASRSYVFPSRADGTDVGISHLYLSPVLSLNQYLCCPCPIMPG